MKAVTTGCTGASVIVTCCPAEEFPADQTEELYRLAGWIKPGESAGFIPAMLKGSHTLCGAFFNGRLIGMMRALSDGVSDAYLLDLVVHPDFRRQGLGKKIAECLAARLTELGIDWIVCIGAPGTESFYKTTAVNVMQNHVPYRFKQEDLNHEPIDQ